MAMSGFSQECQGFKLGSSSLRSKWLCPLTHLHILKLNFNINPSLTSLSGNTHVRYDIIKHNFKYFAAGLCTH